MRPLKFALLFVALVYVLPTLLSLLLWRIGEHPASWGDADWSSAHVLPKADASPEAAFYVLSARTGGLKGAVSVHSWVVVKDKGGRTYERWDKVGWGSPIRHNGYPADGRWYSNEPEIVVARTGAAAEAMIPAVRAAVASYPYAMRGGYHIFPGPNSNTFVEHVMRSVPGLARTLPVAAVGRDFPSGGHLATFDRDRWDLRLSLFGYAGLNVGATSGLELNLLGLVAGLDPARLAVKIPAFGTYGLLARG